MTITQIIAKLEELATATEGILNKEGKDVEMMFLDREDVEAFRGAAEILDDVRHTRRLLGMKDPEEEKVGA